MTLDVNAYIGSWPYWPLIDNDVDSILRKMDEAKIDRAFIASLRSVFVNAADGNREVREVCDNHPDRFSPAYTYHPFEAGNESYTVDLARPGPELVRLFPSQHTYDPNEEPFIDNLLTYCGEQQIPVFIPFRLMMNWGLPMFPIRKIAILARRFPETTFILGSVNYLTELQTAMDALRKCDNLYLETSAMMAFREIETLVAELGSKRLLHGTCNPLQLPAIGPMKIREAEIDEEEKQAILRGNAERLFGAPL